MIFPPEDIVKKYEGTRRGKAMRNWRRVVLYCLYHDKEDLVEYYAPEYWWNLGRTGINGRMEGLLREIGMTKKDFGIGIKNNKTKNRPTTKKEIEFRKMEFIGDAILDGILACHYIKKGYSRKHVGIIINGSISNFMLGKAGEKAGLKAPFTLFEIGSKKYYGSAFERKVGNLLVHQGYEKAEEYVHEWLIPIIDEEIEGILEKAKHP